ADGCAGATVSTTSLNPNSSRGNGGANCSSSSGSSMATLGTTPSPSSKRLIEQMANRARIAVHRSASRYPVSTDDLLGRFFVECGVAKLLRHQMCLEHALMVRG